MFKALMNVLKGISKFLEEYEQKLKAEEAKKKAIAESSNVSYGASTNKRKSTAQKFDVKITENPKLDISKFSEIKDMTISSSSEDGVEYNVSLSNVSCNCHDFLKSRKDYEKTDPRRICKHLLSVMVSERVLYQQPDLIKSMLVRPIHKDHVVTVLLTNGNEAVITHGGNDWADIHTRKKKSGDKGGLYTGDYDRYGLSLENHYWARDKSPAGARELKSIVDQLVES